MHAEILVNKHFNVFIIVFKNILLILPQTVLWKLFVIVSWLMGPLYKIFYFDVVKKLVIIKLKFF